MDTNGTNDGGGEVLGVAGALLLGDVYCARCGYNLRTLAEGAKCPECGLAVAESVAYGRRHGVALRHPRRIAAAAVIAAAAQGLLSLRSVLIEMSLVRPIASPTTLEYLYVGVLAAIKVISGVTAVLVLLLAARSDAPVASTRRNRTARMAGAWALALSGVSETGVGGVMGIQAFAEFPIRSTSFNILEKLSNLFAGLSILTAWGALLVRYFYIRRLAQTRRDERLQMWNWWFFVFAAVVMTAGTAAWINWALSVMTSTGGTGLLGLGAMPLVHGRVLCAAAMYAADALFFYPLVAVVAWRSPKVGAEHGGGTPMPRG